ncbi:MAG TPA: hypothetical protein VHX65_17015 [Pirellulales bacterium]|jgi:hypothetical protein|nr:hypothetical protein [Pirellulales bacterium]
MSNGFDAYHKWLSIPPHDQPPNHYRLLGLGMFESDPDVIAAAADRQMAHVQTYKTGPHSQLSQKLLNEISAAKLCLLRSPKKTAYDEQLRAQLRMQPSADVPGFAAMGGMHAPSLSNSPPSLTPPAGMPSVAASAMAGARGGARHATPFPGYSAGQIGPPPPALPPPVAEAPRQLLGTTTILIAAGAIAVLLLIGIVVVLSNRDAHGPTIDKTTAEKTTSGSDSEASGVRGNTSNGDGVRRTASSSSSVAQSAAVVSPPTNPAHNVPPKKGSNLATRGPGQSPSSLTGPPPAGTSKTPAGQGMSAIGFPAKPPDTATNGVPNSTPSVQSRTPGDQVAATLPPGKPPLGPGPGPANRPPKLPPVDPALAGRAPLPGAAAIADAEKRLGPPAGISPADLLDQAHKAFEGADIYVLLRRALDSAVKQGDAATAISAVDELARRFAVNSLEVRTQALDNLRAHVTTPEAWDALANAASGMIDDAIAAAQPDAAAHLAEVSLTSARKSADLDTVRKVTLQILHLRTGAPGPTPAKSQPTTSSL